MSADLPPLVDICALACVRFIDVATEAGRAAMHDVDVEFQYRNRSASTYDEIFLGLYDDAELRLASFFHELGHTQDERDCTVSWKTKYDQEAGAWEVGFAIAAGYGVSFSEETLRWCKSQLETYREEPGRPEKPWRRIPRPSLIPKSTAGALTEPSRRGTVDA